MAKVDYLLKGIIGEREEMFAIERTIWSSCEESVMNSSSYRLLFSNCLCFGKNPNHIRKFLCLELECTREWIKFFDYFAWKIWNDNSSLGSLNEKFLNFVILLFMSSVLHAQGKRKDKPQSEEENEFKFTSVLNLSK